MKIPITTKNWRWKLAGWLCRLAAWLRGERWYVSNAWHGVPGNRASELKEQIRQQIIGTDGWEDTMEIVDPKLEELAQAAGEAWGHVWPSKNEP